MQLILFSCFHVLRSRTISSLINLVLLKSREQFKGSTLSFEIKDGNNCLLVLALTMSRYLLCKAIWSSSLLWLPMLLFRIIWLLFGYQVLLNSLNCHLSGRSISGHWFHCLWHDEIHPPGAATGKDRFSTSFCIKGLVRTIQINVLWKHWWFKIEAKFRRTW